MDESDFLAGGGEMGAKMRALDWARTDLGSIARWPQSLRITLSTCLASRLPTLISWGPHHVWLYNDALAAMLGNMHSSALGQRGADCWPELWHIVGPSLDGVLSRGEASSVDNQRLVLNRRGFDEERYFNFSCSPIRDQRGVAGVLCAVLETTAQLTSERRLVTLRELATGAAAAVDEYAFCRVAVKALVQNGKDVPFALLYRAASAEGLAKLIAAEGSELGTQPPATLRVAMEDACTDGIKLLDLGHPAALLPLRAMGRPCGYLVAGLNSPQRTDSDFADFLALAAEHIAAGIASARAHAVAHQRAQAAADATDIAIDHGPARSQTDSFHEEARSWLPEPAVHKSIGASSRVLLVGGNADVRYAANILSEHYAVEAVADVEAALAAARARRPEAIVTEVLLPGMIGIKLVRAIRADDTLKSIPILLLWARAADEARIESLEHGADDYLVEPFGSRELLVRVGSLIRTAEIRHQALEQQLHASARLQERLEELDTLMEALPVGVFIARDRACSVISANAAGSALLRQPRAANISKTGAQHERLGFRVLQKGREVAADNLPMQRAARTGLPVAGEEMDVIFDSGDAITLYEYATPLFDANHEPRGSVGVFVDISERKQTERMLLQQNDLLERVALGRPLGECLRAICDAAPALSPGARACILLSDASRTSIESCVSTNLPHGFCALIEGLLIDERMIGTCGEAVYRGVAVTCQDAAAGEWSAAWRNTCLDHGILAFHSEPILGADGLALGSFMLCLDRPRLPREHEQRLARFAARIASIALERDRFTTALLESEARLREADQRKDEFLATLSHELRNPLAPLSNALQLLRRSAIDNEPNARIHEMMRRQVDHLVRLVDDLLETSRITRGVLELRKQRIAVAQVVKNAVESIEPMMQAAQHELTVQLTEEELWLDGDPVRLAQILGNLLNNAAKYTAPRGRIELRVERHGDCARIRVRDNGPGIGVDTLPRIFDMFRSGRRLSGAADTGLGIGLALARRLAEMHGGSLDATSEGAGKGAEFIVTLPLVHDQRVASIMDRALEPSRLHKRILVVDDNVDAAESLGMLLTALGAEVRVAHDGFQALQMYASHQPVAVLLDIGMPGMDGYEVARRLRAEFDEQPAILIALTGWGQESDRRRAHAAGFDHHLIKPVDIATLQKLLDSLDTSGEGARQPGATIGGAARSSAP